MNKLTVVTVNKNNKKGLCMTYASMQNQLVKEINWLVIDGISSDGSLESINNASDEFSLIIIEEKDTGIYDAMNKGIDRVETEFVVFLNSGDTFYREEAVSNILQSISEQPDIDLHLFSFIYSGQQRNPRPIWWRFWSLPTSHQAIIYRSSLLKQAPFNLSYKLAGDYDQFIKLIDRGAKYRSLLTPIVENEPYTSSSNLLIMEKEYRAVLSKIWPNFISLIFTKLRFYYLKLISALSGVLK
jgi:putative colanic acid biosynthesis glycosyltransferase